MYRMPTITEEERLEMQLLFRRCYIGPDAAREIARRIEGEHGFWDYEKRKRAHIRATVLNVVNGGGAPHEDDSDSELAA